MEVWNLIGAICAMPKWFVYAVFCCFRPITVLHIHDDVIKWKHFPRYWPFVRNSSVTGEFPAQRPMTRSFNVIFDLCLNKRLSKQSWSLWFETPSRSLWRHWNVECMVLVPYVNSLALIVCNKKISSHNFMLNNKLWEIYYWLWFIYESNVIACLWILVLSFHGGFHSNVNF